MSEAHGDRNSSQQNRENMNIGDFIQKFKPYPPKMSINFFHERFKIEKNMMCRMCANTVSF